MKFSILAPPQKNPIRRIIAVNEKVEVGIK